MRLRALCLLTFAFLVAPLIPAGAHTPGPTQTPAPTSTTVTLEAAKGTIDIGDSVKLSGEVAPPAPGQPVDIVRQDSRVVAQTVTDDDGRFAVHLAPRHNVTLHAQSGAASSDTVTIKVRPVLTTHLAGVRPYARAGVWGRLRPAQPGKRVTLTLLRNGFPIDEWRSRVHSSGRYNSKAYIVGVGRFVVKASYDDPALMPTQTRSAARSPKTPGLAQGNRNEYVKLLERRLIELGYYLPGANQVYDEKTRDAVIAFNKVQGRARSGSADPAIWRLMSDPKKPRPRFDKPGFHIEIDQTRQIIFLVEKGDIVNFLHTSTGAGGGTHDGTYTVTRKLAGYSGHRLYYPSYFDGLRAIHGWPDVPTYAASHGCARVPMWAATWIYGRADIGTRVYVYH
jgi:peptidoglycan hydrolase-like protein with peptidoglycan-binding domain